MFTPSIFYRRGEFGFILLKEIFSKEKALPFQEGL